MKPLPSSLLETLHLARTEPVPSVDLARVLRALREVAPLAISWRVEFERLFASRGVLSGCAAGAVFLLGMAGWQAWTFWQDVLPWAQLIAAEGLGGGGAS